MNRKARDMQTALVIPCFNEARRISTEYFEELIKLPNLTLIFVNDGSTDSTLQTLSQFVKNENVQILNLKKNVGKAAAIKFGVQKVSEKFHFLVFLMRMAPLLLKIFQEAYICWTQLPQTSRAFGLPESKCREQGLKETGSDII